MAAELAVYDIDKGGAIRFGAPSWACDDELVIAPWLEELIRKYHADTAAPSGNSWARMILLLIAGLIAMVSAPALLESYYAAYPSEPDKRQALEACGRADPTFVRFLASNRAACYEHFPAVIARSQGPSHPF